jgi:hypothetical protein
MTQLETLKREFLGAYRNREGTSSENSRRITTIILVVISNFRKFKTPRILQPYLSANSVSGSTGNRMGNNRATGKTVSRKTQNYYMIALRVFLKFLTRRKSGINVCRRN